MKFKNNGDSKEYKVKAIYDSKVYNNKSEGHLLGFYFLVFWKGYLKKENTWKPVLAIQHLQTLVITFHKEHLKKPMPTILPIYSAPSMSKPIVRSEAWTKSKHGGYVKANGTHKRAKKS